MIRESRIMEADSTVLRDFWKKLPRGQDVQMMANNSEDFGVNSIQLVAETGITS